MITNLFSIFDPSTPYLSSSNWLSIYLLLLFLPTILWLRPSRLTLPWLHLSSYLTSQFKPLLKTPLSILILLSVFLLIIYNNLLGLFPYIFTASAHLAFSLTLALPAWLALYIFNWLARPADTLAHLIPPSTPALLIPFIALIETVRALIRPATLAIRLSANIIAGHLLIVLLSSALSIASTPLNSLVLLGALALSTMELAVALIQAYVFSVLITLYIAETS